MPDNISTKNIERLGEDGDSFVTSIVKEVGKMETTLKPWKSNIVKYYELYKMYQRSKHYDGLAQLFIPEILRAVETIVSNLYRVIFGSDPWFEYDGRTEEEQDSAQAATELVNFQMDENNFKMKIQDSLRQMAVAGLTVRKILWDFHQVKKQKKEYYFETILDGMGGSKRVRRTKTLDDIETVRDHWTVESVDLLGFYISDVKAPYYNIRKADWIGEEYQVNEAYMQKQYKKGWFSDKYKDDIHPQNQEQQSDSQRLKNDLLSTSGYKQNVEHDEILLYEQWGLVKAKYVYDAQELKDEGLEDDDLVEAVVILANKKYIVKLCANPFWHGEKPYLSCPYIPQEGEFAGIGVAQIGQSLQEELNDTRNQTMDNKTLNLMCMWLKNRSAGIKNQDLRVRPLGVIPTNDMNGLQALRPPVLSGIGVNIEGIIKNDLRESVGAPSNLQGIAQSGVGTATESTQINQSAMGRLALTAQLFVELILKPMFILVDSLNQQFYDTEKVIRVVGEQGVHWKSLPPENIISNIKKDVVIKLSTDLDEGPAVKRQQLLQFLTIIQQIPPQVLPFYWKFLDKIYKSFFPSGHDLSDVFPVPEGEEELLDPDQENEVLAMGKNVDVKQGDDDQKHIDSHTKFYDATKFALSQDAHDNTTKHILGHHDSMAKKIQVQAQQQQAQQLAMIQAAQSGKKSSNSGPGLNAGQVSGATAFTRPNVSTNGDLTRNLGA